MNRRYRKTIIAGNWKMNKTATEAKKFADDFKALLPKTKWCDVVVCVPSVDISAAVRPDSICVADGLAMVSIVGRDMAGRPGVSGRLLCALGRAGINVRMVVQGTREINITVGISEPEYEKAVHAVHGEFFPEAPQ